MLWQAMDEMSFRLVGGYALVPGAAGRGSYYIAQGPELSALSSVVTGTSVVSGEPSGSTCRSLEAVVREYDVDALALRTSPGAIRTRGTELLTKLLGPPAASFASGVVWYDVPGRHPIRDCPATS